MISRSLRAFCIAGALSIAGTSSAFASSHDPLLELVGRTNSGLTAEQRTPVGPAIMELRRLSGMTWEQLASLFEVTRRTLHFWASGKALSAGNAEKLYRILSIVKQIDRGSAAENRDLLFTAQPGESAPIVLIRAGQYGEVVRLIGGFPVERPALSPLSPRARSLRMPMKPESLIGALPESIETKSGRTRVARAIRIKNKNQGDDT